MKKILNRRKKKQKKINRIIVIIYIIGFTGGMGLLYGPYSEFRNFLITTAMSTMHHQYLAKWFYTDKTISRVLNANKVVEASDPVNLNLIDTGLIETKNYKDEYDKEILDHDEDELYKIIDIEGDGYKGYMAVIYDASKIKLAVSKNLGSSGEYLTSMSKRMGAVVAINGGGFLDPNGLGNGGASQGILIKDGEILESTRFRGKGGGVIGFTNDNKLFLGDVSANEAVAAGVRDGVEFGPFLIVNGEASQVVGNGGYGIHPRSAIGQRQDGIVLFLVIDGRSLTSKGADMDDMIEIMERYYAYNAANLDGGNSSVLVVNNKIINHPINWDNLEETRPIADGFVVIPE